MLPSVCPSSYLMGHLQAFIHDVELGNLRASIQDNSGCKFSGCSGVLGDVFWVKFLVRVPTEKMHRKHPPSILEAQRAELTRNLRWRATLGANWSMFKIWAQFVPLLFSQQNCYPTSHSCQFTSQKPLRIYEGAFHPLFVITCTNHPFMHESLEVGTHRIRIHNKGVTSSMTSCNHAHAL